MECDKDQFRKQLICVIQQTFVKECITIMSMPGTKKTSRAPKAHCNLPGHNTHNIKFTTRVA